MTPVKTGRNLLPIGVPSGSQENGGSLAQPRVSCKVGEKMMRFSRIWIGFGGYQQKENRQLCNKKWYVGNNKLTFNTYDGSYGIYCTCILLYYAWMVFATDYPSAMKPKCHLLWLASQQKTCGFYPQTRGTNSPDLSFQWRVGSWTFHQSKTKITLSGQIVATQHNQINPKR